jgi:HEAT repeat protein
MTASNPRTDSRSLIQGLDDPDVVRTDAPGWPGALLRLLGEIESSGTAPVLPHLLPLFDSKDQRVSDAVSSALVGVLSRLSPAELAGLDPIVRGGSNDFAPHQQGWYWLSPEALDRQIASGRFPPALLGLASMHPSGYVREVALRWLAQSKDGSEVPYLLIRLNDWVSSVREAARAALGTRLHPDYARHFVRSLLLVLRLTDCGRHDHKPFVAAVLDRLRGPEARSALLEGLSSPDRTVRRACFRLAIEADDIPLPNFLGRALRDDDTMVRLWAARTARSRLAGEDYLGLVPVMSRDRFMPVRREALSGLVEKAPASSGAALRTSLLDPHVSVREVARYYLEKSEGFDARSYYREVIRSGSPEALPQAIAGLGETGTREDAGIVGPWLTHPSTTFRRAAVRALGRLDGDSHVGELLRALNDDQSSVSRLAKEALRGRLHLVVRDRLWELFERNRQSHVCRHALALLSGLGKWEGLSYLILACSDDDPEVAARAQGYIRDWIDRFNRSFAMPSSEDLRRAGDALEASGSALDSETVKLLRFHLKDW